MPVGVRFSASVQIGPEAHPTSCPTGTGPFPGLKQPGRSVNHQPHLASRLKEEYFYILRLLPVWACRASPSVNCTSTSTLRSMCSVPIVVISCSSLTFCFLCMLLWCFVKDFEMVPVAPIITGIFSFTLHFPCISVVNSLYFIILIAFFLTKFLSTKISAS
jgi:hypothetical protein